MSKEPIRVMIADDSAAYRKRLRQAFMRTADIDLIAEAEEGMTAVELIRDLLPDVVVLDSVLPRLDGLTVMRRVRALALEKMPRIILTTVEGAEYYETKAFKLGASFCVDRTILPTQMCSYIRQCMESRPGGVSAEIAEEYALEVCLILEHIRMRPQLDGYAYLRYGVPLVCMDGALMRGITTKIYPMIAQEFDTSSKRVERSIRHAVETTFNTGNYQAIYEIFGNTIDPQRGKPTNGEFIALLAETARLRVRRRLISGGKRLSEAD